MVQTKTLAVDGDGHVLENAAERFYGVAAS